MYQKILLCFGKVCCAPGKFLVFWKRLLCFRLDCCVLEKIAVFSKRLLCSRKDCCVLKKIVVLSKRLLCSSKDCCVSEQKMSCVLPVWATVLETASRDTQTLNLSRNVSKFYARQVVSDDRAAKPKFVA